MDNSEDISAKCSSDVVVEGGSCAAKSDDVEGERSEYEGNGEGNGWWKMGNWLQLTLQQNSVDSFV